MLENVLLHLLKSDQTHQEFKCSEKFIHFCQDPWMSSWTFYQLEQFLAYKSEALGKKVEFVARYTSQKCSRCGHIHSTNRKKSRFSCGSCGYLEHADINAAYNIRDNYILSSTHVDRGAGCSQSPNRIN